MENFLQKLKQTSNPVSGSAVSPQASALINMLKGSMKTGNVNQDIYNPQGYTGTNGYNGDYAALLSLNLLIMQTNMVPIIHQK